MATESDPARSGEGTYDRKYEQVARRLLAVGVRPNHFTLLQMPVFGGMVWAALYGHVWWFFGLSWFVIVLDGGDGILARVGGLQSKLGALLDTAMDTVGVAVVLWGASRFAPDFTWAFAALFAGNVGLYLQNGLLHEKVVSYVRGPIILGIVAPNVVVLALLMTGAITGFLLAVRLPRTFRRIAGRRQPPAP